MTEAYRTPEERFEGLPGYPFAPNYVELDGLRMHYVDEGEGPTVLLLHGEPTWSYLYRKVIAELTPTARTVAPDWFGFGRSDKPVRAADYTYDFHVRSLTRFAEQLDLRDVTLVVHDWGGPIGLRWATENPDRVARLVVTNTGFGGGRAPSDEWLRFREWVRRLGTELVPGRLLALSAVQPLPDAVEEAYNAPFPVAESKAGVVAFPELVPVSPDHPDLAAHLAVRDALARWEKPTLVLFADSDPIFSTRHAERVAEHIPGAGEAEIVAGAGHFLHEDKGEEVGARIARFLVDS